MKEKLFKKALAVATSVLMLSGGVPIQPLSQVFEDIAITASAESTITPVTPQLDSNGFYSIGSAAELYGFAELVNSGNASANAKLTADIVVNENVLDANGEANTGDFVQWTPIGNNGNSTTYSGTFDGQGHTVSGLYVSGSGWYVGFVGQVSGTAVVKNLGIVDSYFSSSNNYLGSIVGGVAAKSSVTIANVYSTSTVKGDNWIGGLVGDGGLGCSVTIVNSYFAGKTSSTFLSGEYGTHHDDLVSGAFGTSVSGTLDVVNTFVLGTSNHGTTVTAEQLSDGTVAAALHYYQDALADGSMFGLSGGKTDFSGTLEGVSVTTADITLHTFDGDATAYSSKYIVGNTTPLPVMVEREGYTFLGWYDNADFESDAVTQIPSSATGDKEYWAKFVRSHSVSFVLNDGSIFKGEIDHYIEGETTVLPTFVTKNGASFEGWYTTEDFTGDRYYSIPATATEDMTFYAKWGAKKTTFYLGQGPEPVNILYEGENMVWLDKTTMERYVIFDNFRNYWGSNSGINVPYTGGESTFGSDRSKLNVAQSGFYVFTLTDKGGGNWFVSVLRSVYNCTIATQTYTGSAIEPEIVCDGITLVKGTDYDVLYSDNINVGTAKATITGKGNYCGTVEKTFTIAKALTAANVSDIAAQTYTGSAITPTVTVKDGSKTLALNTDYTVSYSNNTNVGTATIKITGKGNYSGTVEKTFAINKATPTVIAPTPKNPTHYSSPVELINAGESEVGTLYYSLGTSSKPGESWTADASEITANSAGTFYVWYRIGDDDTTLDMITVTVSQGKLSQSWSILIDSYEYDGTAHLPTIDGTAYGTLTYSYYNIDTDEVTTQAPSAVGNYRVTATASGDENYIAAVRQASYSITETKAAEPIIVRARNAYFTGLMDLVVKFKLPDEVVKDTKAYVEYSWTEGTEKRTEKKLVSELPTGTVGDDKVYVVENPVYAPEMENKVTYKFFDGNGKQLDMTNTDKSESYKDGYQFSLRDYLDLAMANGNDDMKALADAAYDYGIASQINFKYGDYQNLKVSDKVKAVKLSDLEKYKLTESGTLPEIIKNVKYSVEFAMDNTLRVKFNFKKAPTDAELKSLTCTIDGKAAELVKLGDTQYALVVSNIAAPQIDTAHTFTISDGKNTYTTVRSALSYAYSAIEANTNPTLVDLAKAMYLYNQAANEKFAE